jgi:hypothetical protein
MEPGDEPVVTAVAAGVDAALGVRITGELTYPGNTGGRRDTPHPAMRRGAILNRSLSGFLVALIGTVAVAACGSTSIGSTAPATASPTPAGPPSGTGSSVGDANVSGPITVSSVLCFWPSANGPDIRVFAQPMGQPSSGVGLVILIQPHTVNVRAATGSGSTYAQREFNGTGVSGFDGTRGATVDSTLVEDKTAGAHPGVIGAMASIHMTVACGDEQAGSASVSVTGSTPGGALSGRLTSPRVDCATYAQGKTAVVTALTQVGGRTVLIIVGVSWAGITVATDAHFYTNTGAATGSVSGTTAHWNGDVTDTSSGATLHVSGDATCGSSTAT